MKPAAVPAVEQNEVRAAAKSSPDDTAPTDRRLKPLAKPFDAVDEGCLSRAGIDGPIRLMSRVVHFVRPGAFRHAHWS